MTAKTKDYYEVPGINRTASEFDQKHSLIL
jgi:curved DNA-binding protein CbpA